MNSEQPTPYSGTPMNTVYRLDSKAFAMYSLALVHSIPSWLLWAEIECTGHVALLKWPLKPVSTSLAKQATGIKSLLS